MDTSLTNLFEAINHGPAVYKGSVVCRYDYFTAGDFRDFRLAIESTKSDMRQAVGISVVNSKILYQGEEMGSRACFFEASGHLDIEFSLTRKTMVLEVFNMWEHRFWEGSKKMMSLTSGGAMILESFPGGRRYRCNDGEYDDDFDDMIFRLERIKK